ncbi:MAG: hypothetical protein C0404_07465 [Verrucomicrobia bacterium]|nr:hypothetical protein [Verrucomicrobiota bacterium]
MNETPGARRHERSLPVIFAVLCVRLALPCSAGTVAAADDWKLQKSEHFLVYHKGTKDAGEGVAKTAEAAYDRITGDLGFKKSDNFWLWDDRLKIRVYPTKDAFAAATQAPDWAVGKSTIKTREIDMYDGGEAFVTQVVGHELAHMVLSDYFGRTSVPLWLSEGFAEREESVPGSGGAAGKVVLAGTNNLFSIKELTGIRSVAGDKRAGIFYGQSASLVDFLITVYGSDLFRKLCGQLRDGKDLDEALRFTYPDTARSVEKLEEAWKRHIHGLQGGGNENRQK